MVVPPEVNTLFKLNIPTHMKWLVYDALWKNVYTINEDLKQDIISKSLMFMALSVYKAAFTVASKVIPLNVISDRQVRVTNKTHYLDAILFDLYVITQNITIAEEIFAFSCVIWDNDQIDDEFDELDIQLYMRVNHTDDYKKVLVRTLWEKLNDETKSSFFEKIDLVNNVTYPIDVL